MMNNDKARMMEMERVADAICDTLDGAETEIALAALGSLVAAIMRDCAPDTAYVREAWIKVLRSATPEAHNEH